MNASEMTVKELREILVREGYHPDRNVRKPQLVIYVEDLIDFRHGEALEMDEKISALREWYATAATKGADHDAHLPVAGVAGTSLGEMREAFRKDSTPAKTRKPGPITFPNIGIVKGSRVWRNRETGVEIVKGANFAEVGLYYICVPTAPGAHDGAQGRRMVAHRTSFAEAREIATRRAAHWRAVIARANTIAHDEASEIEQLLAEGDAIRKPAVTDALCRHGLLIGFGRCDVAGCPASGARESGTAEAERGERAVTVDPVLADAAALSPWPAKRLSGATSHTC